MTPRGLLKRTRLPSVLICNTAPRLGPTEVAYPAGLALNTSIWYVPLMPRAKVCNPAGKAPRSLVTPPDTTFTFSADSFNRNEIVPALFVRPEAYGVARVVEQNDKTVRVITKQKTKVRLF